MATNNTHKIVITKTDGNWQIGMIDGIEFWAKVYEEDSENGLNGGNISKLTIKGLAEYDRGWDTKPKTKGAQNLVDALITYFSDIENCKEKPELKRAVFCRKASNLSDIDWVTERGKAKGMDEPYIVEKTVILTPFEFKAFCDDLLEDKDFIEKADCEMLVDANGVWHCMAVTSNDSAFAILVEADGYNYARYTAKVKKEDIQ